MVRILIVDDQKVIREGLKLSLESHADLEIVGLAENGQIAIDLVDALRPDVVLLDMEMPIMDGAAATRAIRQRFENTKVLVLTSSKDDTHIAAVLAAGAHGYLLKDTPIDDLVNAICSANKGYTQLSPGLLDTVQVHPPSAPSDSPQPGKFHTDIPSSYTMPEQEDASVDFVDSDRLYTDDFIRENENASRLLLFSVICAGMLTLAFAIGYALLQQGQQVEQQPEPLQVPELPQPDPQFTIPPADLLPENNQNSPIDPSLPVPPPIEDSTDPQINRPPQPPTGIGTDPPENSIVPLPETGTDSNPASSPPNRGLDSSSDSNRESPN